MRTGSRRRGQRRVRALLGIALALAVGKSASPGTAGEATLEVVVPPGSWKGVRLRNIPENATLSASVASDGSIGVLLLDAEQYAAFPADPKAVFRGRTDEKLDFAVRAPVRGDYYLIVDNRTGSQARAVQLTIRGEVAGATTDGAPRSAPGT